MLRKAEFWGGLFWVALGSFIIWQGRELGLGKLNDPGSGFALFWLGIITVVLALSVIVAAKRGEGRELSALWANIRYGKVLFVLVLLLVFGVLFEPVGFIPCTLVLLLALMLLVDPVDWKIAIPVAILATGGVWWVLTKWLLIQLPAGVLAGLLP